MISNAKVYQRVNQLLKSGTSGYQNADEYNNDSYATLLDILNVLCDNYEKNEKISDLLNKDGHIVSDSVTTNSAGFYTFPANHYRTFNIKKPDGIIEYPVKKINTNEVGMYLTSPVRAFNAAKNIYGYYMSNGGINVLPAAITTVKLTYCKKPIVPNLVLTYDGNDYETVGAGTTDIGLPENLFNLFCYKMLESASVEMKERLTMEYATMGINREG